MIIKSMLKKSLVTIGSLLALPAGAVTLTNPLGPGTTFRSLAVKVFESLYQILIVIIPIIIVVGAFQMLFSGGEPEKFKRGQRTIVYAVIGLAIIIMAQGIVAIVESIFKTGV